jgi:hypothetical protein
MAVVLAKVARRSHVQNAAAAVELPKYSAHFWVTCNQQLPVLYVKAQALISKALAQNVKAKVVCLIASMLMLRYQRVSATDSSLGFQIWAKLACRALRRAI